MGQLLKSLSDVTAEAVTAFNKALSSPLPPEAMESMGKGITQATGLVAYDLQAPAKQFIPVLTPLRNMIPRVSGGGGTATNWKSVTKINSSALRSFVPEGERNGAVATTVVDKHATYKTFGLEDYVTFEAETAAKTFEDIRATTAQRLLWATMIEEELNILGANNSLTLATPGTITGTRASDATYGGILQSGGTYKSAVVALTLHGFMASSVSGGVAQTVSVVPMGGGVSFTYGGGSSAASATASTGAFSGATNTLALSVPPVSGAVGYAWYVDDGAGGTLTLQAITTINSVKLTGLTTTGQAVTDVATDASTNALAFDGILYQAFAAGSGAYIKTMGTGTAGAGTGLSSNGAGGILEIDEMLKYMWDYYRLSPTRFLMNSQERNSITNKILAGGGASYVITAQNPGPGLANLTGGTIVTNYLNKFTMQGNPNIPMELHPNMPAGTLLAICEQLPYPINGVPNVIEMRLRRDYYQMEWPLRKRQYETGVYCDGVLACYFPPSIGIITNISNL